MLSLILVMRTGIDRHFVAWAEGAGNEVRRLLAGTPNYILGILWRRYLQHAGHEENAQDVGDRNGEDHGIEPVHHPAVSRQDVAHVLDAEFTLDH